ncbi:MerR family transcriptional regulator [Streptomyces siamensis]|uniref:MerR family transcriptional regulator n=1 Tax=Streptomyces siamensis TaxID=1274986 RepID=A0ABP9J3Q8_9ACTN
MRIGALARATGVSQRLLRYYEEQGLLRPTRQPNGYREYAEADMAAVRRIRTLIQAGLPTAVIAHILACVHDDGTHLIPSTCPGVTNHLRREQARVVDAITQLRTAQQALDELLGGALQLSRHDTAEETRHP